MPVLTVYRHGVTAGVPPTTNTHPRALRGLVKGWTPAATRRNTQFLYSIREQDLTGEGWAVTLTVRTCPPTPEHWSRLRKAWTDRMLRSIPAYPMIRLHWVTEWQRRGVPHLHAAIWFPEGFSLAWKSALTANHIITSWLIPAAPYGAGYGGQQAKRINGAVGWFQYVSKHAARGVKHYQRSSENLPPEWQGKTGRVWGYGGHWPRQERVRVGLQGREGDGGYFAYRRIVRSWRVADARAEGDRRRVLQAKSMLTCHRRPESEVRGVSEWMPQDLTLAVLWHLGGRGYSVTDQAR